MNSPLKDRVIAFKCMELPGQPMMMHMGTSYLVNDLWSAIERLTAERDNLIAQRTAETTEFARLVDHCKAERDDLGDDLAQARRYIVTLTDERDTYIELWRKALIERDAYQVAADKQAMEHKVERDALSVQIDALEKDAARMQGDMLLPANA